jgi:Gpi18-like mannosyltransferase
LHKKEATRFAQDATLLFSFFLLTSFELPCIGGTHTLFGFLVFLCLKAYLLSMLHNGYFFFFVSFSPSLLWSFAQLRHTHKPSHGRDTCAMLGNT